MVQQRKHFSTMMKQRWWLDHKLEFTTIKATVSQITCQWDQANHRPSGNGLRESLHCVCSPTWLTIKTRFKSPVSSQALLLAVYRPYLCYKSFLFIRSVFEKVLFCAVVHVSWLGRAIFLRVVISFKLSVIYIVGRRSITSNKKKDAEMIDG